MRGLEGVRGWERVKGGVKRAREGAGGFQWRVLPTTACVPVNMCTSVYECMSLSLVVGQHHPAGHGA